MGLDDAALITVTGPLASLEIGRRHVIVIENLQNNLTNNKIFQFSKFKMIKF